MSTKIPLISKITGYFSRLLQSGAFKGSQDYWEKRYVTGGDSGRGSYGALASYKAAVLNSFVKEKNITSVIEFGCGDGNQLTLASYPEYTGLDVSVAAIKKCMALFKDDHTKSFYLYDSMAFADHQHRFRSTLTLSLDVIYHLVEYEVYEAYLHHLFQAAEKYVIIYACDVEGKNKIHVQHRKFSDWIAVHQKEWRLIKINTDISKHPEACDFFFYEKID